MTLTQPWIPIAQGSLAKLASKTVDEIAEALKCAELETGDIAGGTSGLALFWAYYGACRDDEDAEARSIALVNRSVDLADQHPTLGLYSGLLGIGWVIEHIAGDPDDAEDPCVDLDSILDAALARETWSGPYDLIDGLVGFAVYALERCPRENAVRQLSGVLTHLERLAVRRDGGVTWHTPAESLLPYQRERWPDGYFNLGVAHGVPGIIAVLSKMIASGVEVDRAMALLRPATDWLLVQRLSGTGGAFSSWMVERPADTVSPARTAWCYGDPGVAATLTLAANALGDNQVAEAAIDVARQAAMRVPERTGVVDAGLCHGALGLFQVFAQLSRMWGQDAILRRAALDWLEQGVAMRDVGAHARSAGFWAVGPERKASDVGFLGGAAGIGLALLAATSEVEPLWDSILLTS